MPTMSDPALPSIVHIVDDDDSMRAALARLLSAAGYRARTYASAGEFLVMAAEERTGCLLLDLHMPGPDGLVLQEALARSGARLPTVFLSGRGDIASSVRALKGGAFDFLTKPVAAEVLLEAVRAALAAGATEHAERDERTRLARCHAALTASERAVLQHVVAGARTRQIADELGVSERTVKSWRASMMDKMGVGSIAELMRLHALLGPP
jgi:FixJ family two-component response regulator